jgi:hypothetical protein
MAEIVDRCQALVDEHFSSEEASHGQLQNLLPNPVLGWDGELIKEAGSILPVKVVDRINELSYEFMNYPDDVAKLGLKYYRTHMEGDG